MSRYGINVRSVSVIFIQQDGSEHPVSAPEGSNLMRLAKISNIDMWARCGGNIKCGTCRVEVEGSQASMLPRPSDDETDMLMQLKGCSNASRLACQLYLRPGIEGLKLRVCTSLPSKNTKDL